MNPIQALAQTLGKPEEGHNNQDAFALHLDGESPRLGLSDGAGGYGALNQAWAKTLVAKLPEQAPQNSQALDAWLDTWCGDFVEAQSAKLSNQASPYLSNKFNKEGSAATLLGAWFNTQAPSLELLSYGDSFYIYYESQTGKYHFPAQRQNPEAYLRSPYLLNWNQENSAEQGFSYGKFEQLHAEDWLWLASDALGQLAINLYYLAFFPEVCETWLSQQAQSFYRLGLIKAAGDYTWANFSAELAEVFRDSARFQVWLKDFRDKDWLEEDDYTGIYITWPRLEAKPAQKAKTAKPKSLINTRAKNRTKRITSKKRTSFRLIRRKP